MRSSRIAGISLVLLSLIIVPVLSACSRDVPNMGEVVFGDWGIGPTCLAPFYLALEEGYFEAEGLKVEHRRYPGMKEVNEALSLGKVTFSPVPTHLVNLIEEGFDAKGTLGIHPGCMQGIADARQAIYKVEDLKGKRIGVDGFGHCPHAFTMWELKQAGLDPEKDAEIVAYPAPELLAALKAGKIDAMLALDPIGQLAINQGIGRLVFSTTYPEHGYSNVHCCVLAINGQVVDKNRDTAAAITRAVAAATRSIPGREQEVADMMIEKGYSIGDPSVHAYLLRQYDYANPSVQAAKDTLAYYGALYQQVGIIGESTDIGALVEKGFVELIPEISESRVPPPPVLAGKD